MKKIFNRAKIFIILALSAGILLCNSCANAAQVKTKEQARQKINHLKWLEKVEHNKLYKNQQKLENTASNLVTTRKKLDTAVNELAGMESRLNTALAEFAALDFRMKSRIRKIYKTQRRG